MPERFEIYRHNTTERYLTVRRAVGTVEVFPETGCYAHRGTSVLTFHEARSLLRNFTDTGVSLPRNHALAPGSFLTRRDGSFFLSIEDVCADDKCVGLDTGEGGANISRTTANNVFERILSGELTMPEKVTSSSTAEPEKGRFYSIGCYFFSLFDCGYKGYYHICPENGWHKAPVKISLEVFQNALAGGFIKPIEGPMFKIRSKGQLLPMLTRYQQFELLDTGETLEVKKVSPNNRYTDTAPWKLTYDELITLICCKSLVPRLSVDIHF